MTVVIDHDTCNMACQHHSIVMRASETRSQSRVLERTACAAHMCAHGYGPHKSILLQLGRVNRGERGRSNSKAQATNDDDAQCGFNKTRTARVKTIRRCTAAIVAAHWLRYTRVLM